MCIFLQNYPVQSNLLLASQIRTVDWSEGAGGHVLIGVVVTATEHRVVASTARFCRCLGVWKVYEKRDAKERFL